MPGSGGNLGFPSRIFREMGADGPVRRQELNVHAFLARLGAQSLSLRPAPGQYIPPPLTPVVIFFACRQRPSGSTRHGLSIRAYQRAHGTFSRLAGLYGMMSGLGVLLLEC